MHKKGDTVELVGDSGRVWGAALRAGDSKMPVYVSQGHRVSLETSLAIVKMSCGKTKIPEPIR